MDQKSESEDKIRWPRSRQSKYLKRGKEAFHAQGEGVDFTVLTTGAGRTPTCWIMPLAALWPNSWLAAH